MQGFTTVAVSKETLAKLKRFREYGRESYDEVINKIMALVTMAGKDSDGELNEETKKELDEAMLEMKQGKCMSTKDLMKKLGVD